MDQPEILSECIVSIESVPDDEADEKLKRNSTESWEPYSLKIDRIRARRFMELAQSIAKALPGELESINKLESRLQSIRKTAEAKRTCVQLVPVVVGDSLSSITSSYVVIGNHPILLESPLRAVEGTLKAFHALNCNYPIQSSRPWAVIAQCLMGIQDTWHSENVNSRTVKHIIEKLM